jgi:hypothetical protein
MSFWRVAAGLVVLFCFLTSVAAGGDFTYSGVPGKWKKGSKVDKDKDKDKPAESEAPPEVAPKEVAPKEKGKRTKTIPAPTETVTPESDSSKKK